MATSRRSTTGCTLCKTRRKKCDETKPHCLRCLSSESTCVYDYVEPPEGDRYRIKRTKPGPRTTSGISRQSRDGSTDVSCSPSGGAIARPRLSRVGSEEMYSDSSGPLSYFPPISSQLFSDSDPLGISFMSQDLVVPATPGPQILPWTEDDEDDPEGVRLILLTTPNLDRNAKENALSFVLHCYSQWALARVFEPAKLAHAMRNQVVSQFSSERTRRRTVLIANVMEMFARQLRIDRTRRCVLDNLVLDGQTSAVRFMASPVASVPALDRKRAIDMLDSMLEVFSLQIVTQSVAACLRSLEVAAPVFRRACVEPPGHRVNLANILLECDLNLRHFATLDIIHAVTTGLRTHIPYDAPFSLEVCERMYELQDSSGLQWLHGFPDQFVLLFGWIISLCEGGSQGGNLGLVTWIETHLPRIRVAVDESGDPALRIGRMVVQECWRFAVLIYLYMVLCRVDAQDPRVVRAQKGFMRLVRGAKPARNPDAYLFTPMVIAGVATVDQADQATVRERILGVCECAEPGTVGNDVMLELEDIWARTRAEGRPAVWTDLRVACFRVSGRNKTCDRTRPSCKRCGQGGVECGYVDSKPSNLQAFSSGASDAPNHSLGPISHLTSLDSLFVPNPGSLSLGLSPASTYYSHSSLSPDVASYTPQTSLSPEFTGPAFFNPPPQGPPPPQHWPTIDDDSDSDDPEDVKHALAEAVAITGHPENDSVVDCYAQWMIRFLFEPLRGIPTAKNNIIQGFARGGEILWRMMLLANVACQIVGNTPYDLDSPPYFATLYSHVLQRLGTARSHFEPSRDLDRCYALGAIEQTFDLACILLKVGTLADIINLMEYAAPVFRRACPDSPEHLVNLPSLLTTIDISLQSYATHDILFSMLTHRPMFFRYDVAYPPHISDAAFTTEDGPGLRWLYGVPDWLMVILARMNTLLEDYGSCVSPEVAIALEEEIRSKRTIVAAGVDPSLSMGRIVVQESWRLAALVYLFMALCGADSKDARVTKVYSKFMKLYSGVEARRIPDSFLVLPMLLLGLPAPPKDRKVIRERMLDLMECSRPNTLGNEIVRILDDIWTRADERGRASTCSSAAGSSVDGRAASGGPEGSSSTRSGSTDGRAGAVVWTDLRMGCLRVTGM